MSTTYINFTSAERKQARMTDLAEFLRRQGYDLKREGRGFIWMNECEKVSVQGNLWYNQYTREGGDAIDFARRFFDCPDYPSAVHRNRRYDMGLLDTFYQDKLPSRAVTVYLYLRERSNKDGTCFPSVPTVSRDTGLSEATVKRAIQDLVSAGWLQKEPRLRRNGARSRQLQKTIFLPRRNSASALIPAPVHRERGKGRNHLKESGWGNINHL